MSAQVVTLHESNFRDPVATLRAIADEIEAGKYGEVGCIGIAFLADRLEVFGAGPDSEAPTVACTLQAGANMLINELIGHGR